MRQEPLVVTLGPTAYELERPWGRSPKGVELTLLSKLAVDSAGNVYVFRRGDPPVIVFDRQGAFLSAWGEDLVSDPHGLFITEDDRIFLVDRDAHQIVVCDRAGKLLMAIGDRNKPTWGAPFNHPTDIAVASNGDIYVADGYGNSNVHWFSANGALRRTWGRPGGGPGEFTTPHGIAVLKDGRVLVGDRENNRVQVFTHQGEYLDEWRDFYHPMDIYVDWQERVYVTDQIPRLTLLSNEGTLLGRCRPVFNTPHGCRGDADGNLFLVDQRWNHVVKLRLISSRLP